MTRLPALSRLESLDVRGVKLGLAAIDAVCERLGRPERAVESILVAGTNGKGSTAATLASSSSRAMSSRPIRIRSVTVSRCGEV